MNAPLKAEPTENGVAQHPERLPTRVSNLLREAVFGSQQNFTEGSIGRAVMLLAIPMVLEMSMESLFAIVNVFWVAHLGADAIAIVGLTESVLMLVYCCAM